MKKNKSKNTNEDLLIGCFIKYREYKNSNKKLLVFCRKIRKRKRKIKEIQIIQNNIIKKYIETGTLNYNNINKKIVSKPINTFEETMLQFVDYINNFKPLYNENINRLKYYHYFLSKNIYKKENINNFNINNEYLLITSRMFNDNVNETMLKSSLISLIIIFYSYKEIIGFIPKKNIFCKKITKKINNLANFFIKNITFDDCFYIDDIISKTKYITTIDYFRTLSFRQKYRNNYNNTFSKLYFNSSTNI